jgi:hypothetical protein
VLLWASISFGQSVSLRFPTEGEREIWTAEKLPSEAPTTGIKTHQSGLEFDNVSAAPTDTLFIWDKSTGNIAARPVGEARKAITWELEPKDYQYIGQVKVFVESNGRPVASASVKLQDGKRTQERLVDSGEATFFCVKPGSLKVTVKYNSAGKSAEPVTQLLDVALKRANDVPSVTIALPEAAATTADAEKSSSEKPALGPDGKPVPPTKPFGAVITYLVALGIAGALGYVVYKFFKDNPDQVGSKLEQLGVQIPKSGDDALNNADPVVPLAPIKPEPPQKIILDDSDPVSPAAAVVSPSVPVTPGEPTLVSETGVATSLLEGETLVGRDAGLGMSLAGEGTVSRRHASLVRTGASVLLKDLGSTNGTWVNGSKVDGEVALRPGDTVQFGSVRFRYEG